MGNMGDLAILLVGIVDALFAFFVVAPILLNTASLFGVQKRFAQAMVEEGVIDAATVKQMHSKKQIAGEFEGGEVLQKIFPEESCGAEIIDIFLIKV